jgi:hypothetical protein
LTRTVMQDAAYPKIPFPAGRGRGRSPSAAQPATEFYCIACRLQHRILSSPNRAGASKHAYRRESFPKRCLG